MRAGDVTRVAVLCSLACAVAACGGPPEWSAECAATEAHLERVYQMPDVVRGMTSRGDVAGADQYVAAVADDHKLYRRRVRAYDGYDGEDSSEWFGLRANIAIRNGRRAAESLLAAVTDDLEAGRVESYYFEEFDLRWRRLDDLRTACTVSAKERAKERERDQEPQGINRFFDEVILPIFCPSGNILQLLFLCPIGMALLIALFTATWSLTLMGIYQWLKKLTS